ncbi:unnamed protein product, partial [Allacma fusca]
LGEEEIPDHYQLLFNLGTQTTFVCLEDFQIFATTNLSRPKTALVVYKGEFYKYQRFLEKNISFGAKFAHNFENDDGLLKSRKGFYISNTGDKNYDWVHRRMEVLLSSGIYWFWADLEQTRMDRFKPTSNALIAPAKSLEISDFELALIGWIYILM